MKKPVQPDTFADRLRFILQERSLSAYALSQRSGVSQQTLSNLLLGKRQPTLPTLQRLCAALDLSLSAFDGLSRDG